MTRVTGSLTVPLRYSSKVASPRGEDKKAKIVDAAMRHFAEHGYQAARVGDIAALARGFTKARSFSISAARMASFLKSTKKLRGRFRDI